MKIDIMDALKKQINGITYEWQQVKAFSQRKLAGRRYGVDNR